MTTSYAIIEKVRKAISTDYVQASDAQIARALGISRATISAYKKGAMVMNPQTLNRAAELCKWERDDLTEYFLAVSQDATPQAKLVWEAQQYMLKLARQFEGKVPAILVTGTFFAVASAVLISSGNSDALTAFAALPLIPYAK